MTAPSPALFPAGRTLAGWWRQLAPWQPTAVWVGQLLLQVLGQVSYLPGEIRQRLLIADRGLSSLSQGGARTVKLGSEFFRDALLHELDELFL